MIETREVTLTAGDGRPMRGALALPEAPGPHPGVLVIHEIFGLSEQVRGFARKFAELGYVALAPDLFHGRAPQLLCVARALRSFNRGQGPQFEDLAAGHRFLAELPEVDPARLGVAGFCLGGGFAVLHAARTDMKAAAVFYGPVPETLESLSGICPTVASFGGRDGRFGRFAEVLEQHLTALDVPHEVKVYEDAGHGFMARYTGLIPFLLSKGPEQVGHHPEATADSWRRVEAFFDTHLRRAPPG